MTIACRLSEYLLSKSIRQKEVAQAIDVAQSTLSTWLKRGEDIPAAYVLPICRFLGIRTDWLLGGEGDPVEESVPVQPEPETPELSPEEQFLLDAFQQLDYEGKTVVTGHAISELRRVKALRGEKVAS